MDAGFGCSAGLPYLIALLLVVSLFAQHVPQISISGDKSAGAANAGSSKDDVMQSLLNWGIKHSDPEKLKELMQKYQQHNLTIKDVYGEDVLDALFVNEGELMQNMTNQISKFANPAIADEDLEVSLTQLLELVEQVDNAGNLHQMGGLKALLDLGVLTELAEGFVRNESVRALALWTLGVALQNNAPVQEDVVRLGGLPLLLGRLPSCGQPVGNHDLRLCLQKSEEVAGDKYCNKLLFAISGLVKNNAAIQIAADDYGLFDWLLEHGISHPYPAIAKKSLGLLDIVLSQNPDLGFVESLSSKQGPVADALLKHIHSFDVDGVEKAIRLVNRLVSLRPMLFRVSFGSDFSDAMVVASRNCKDAQGVEDEFCAGLNEIADLANLALTARDLSDDDL